MQDYKVKQIQPNHADHISGYKEKYLEEMFKNESCIAEPKYDGERMLIHINNGEVYCTSRRFSKKTNRYMENQDKLPALQEALKKFPIKGYTVVDCEAYAKDWSTAVGILHSLPERAIELQKQDTLKFAVFDCLFYDGNDIRDKEYEHRLSFALDVVNKANYAAFHFVAFMSAMQVNTSGELDRVTSYDHAQALMTSAISAGFEGIVIKSLDRKYYDKAACLKCKKFETVDVVVGDYQVGRGKYSNTVGALHVGYMDEDQFVWISNVNCGTDEERDMWRDKWSELKNSVIEVKCQEITAKSLRHPVYIRMRPDKTALMVTKETIFKE